LVERYAIRWSFMLVNISSQREADLTDIGRFRGRGIHRETREYSLLFLTLAVLLACETRTGALADAWRNVLCTRSSHPISAEW
jgi:hypothetical protein